MKAVILKENFKKGLNIVEKLVGKNLTLPILNNVLITTEKNFLKLSSTDLEIGINYWALAKTEEEGKAAVPAKLLSALVTSIPEKTLNLEVKNNSLYIKCENYKSQIKGLDPEEFPIIPQINTENSIEINSQPFCQGISQVVNFSAASLSRPEISGVFLNFQKDQLKIVATDGFRLAEKSLYFDKKEPGDTRSFSEASFILPQRTARELINVIGDQEEKLKIFFSPNQTSFELPWQETSHPQFKLVSRLIEGEYPSYQEIIPQKYAAQIVLSTEEFLSQIKAASLFSGKNNEIKIKTNSSKNEIEILAENPEVGENKSILKGEIKAQDADMEVSFNFKFLIEGLLNIRTEKVIFGLNTTEGPAALRPMGDASYIYVVMPIKS